MVNGAGTNRSTNQPTNQSIIKSQLCKDSVPTLFPRGKIAASFSGQLLLLEKRFLPHYHGTFLSPLSSILRKPTALFSAFLASFLPKPAMNKRQSFELTEAPVKAPTMQNRIALHRTRDEADMARLGKRQVLKVGSRERPRFRRVATNRRKRNWGFMSMLGFSCTMMVTWEAILM